MLMCGSGRSPLGAVFIARHGGSCFFTVCGVVSGGGVPEEGGEDAALWGWDRVRCSGVGVIATTQEC